MFWVAAIVAVVLALAWVNWRAQVRCARMNIPSAPAKFPLHALLQLLVNPPWDVMEDWVRRVGAVVSFRFLRTVYVVVADADIARHMMGRKLSNYPKDLESYRVFHDLLGTGLVTSGGEYWRRQRALVSAPFKREMLCRVVPLAWEAAHRVSKSLLKTEKANESLDIAEEFRHMTLQVIGEALLGMTPKECDAVFPDLYLPIVEEVNRRAWYPFRKYLPLPATFRYNACVKQLNRFVTNMVTDRVGKHHARVAETHAAASSSSKSSQDDDGSPKKRQEVLEEDDILDYIVRAAFPGDTMLTADAETEGSSSSPSSSSSSIAALSDVLARSSVQEGIRQLRDEVKTFLLAGHETSSMMLTWALFELTKHPDMLDRVRAEADAVFGRDALRTDACRDGQLPSLEKLKTGLAYTDAVLRETLRLYSVVPIVARMAAQDDRVNQYQFLKGTKIMILIKAIHHDAKYWDEPSRFDPSRFLDAEAMAKRHPYAFLPFTNGPRNCIGQYFSMLESKIVLSLLVQRFDISLALSEEESAKKHPYVIPLAPLHGFPVKVQSR